LFLLFLAEQTALVPRGATEVFWRTHRWTWLVLAIEKGVPTAFVIGVAGATLLSWETFRSALRSLVEDSSASGFKWLLTHLAVLAALLGWAELCRANRIFPSPYWEIWMWVRVALELLALASWAMAALPPSFWLRWLASSPSAFVAGAAFALITKMLGHYTEALWGLFQSSTFLTVAALLRLCGQVVITGPAKSKIGTPAFSVEVAGSCSGLEGFGVMVAFLAIYFWVYRRELRFPQVLLLIPIGLALQWFLNSVRIAVLILLGTWNQKAAVEGFHSTAGWLFVSLVAYGLVSASWRVPAFTRIGSQSQAFQRRNPAGVYLVPLFAIIATAMLTRIFHGGFDLLYPLRVLAAAGALYFYRRELAVIRWSASLGAVALGLLVFVMWIALAPANDASINATFATGISRLSAGGKAAWFLFRIAGAVITVPLAEELAFRGYLTRKLIADDFEAVPLGRFTWFSFLLSSVLFGVLHGQWLAGTLAGMVFAAALYRRGLLADAVVAHSVTNALLSAYVLTTHDWSLWT
jgi:exosortase E/protease (VPEID-CTERM system)